MVPAVVTAVASATATNLIRDIVVPLPAESGRALRYRM
jgi:hypothetical protein